jgi:glycosyltransferase
MKISIITCCYNSDKTLKHTFSSIREQIFKNIELIVIDGDSTDNTKDIINNNIDLIDVYISEKDNGVYDAMNKGIRISTGDVIGFLNSDDFFYSNDVLFKINQHFENKSSDITYGNMHYVDKDDIKKIKRIWISGKFNSTYFEDGWVPGHPTFYAKKELYDKFNLFDLDFKLAADYELMFRFMNIPNLKIDYIEEILVVMRLGGLTSGSIKNRFYQNIEIKNAWKKNNKKFPKLFFVKKIIKRIKQILK